jgi:hypothetical protein
MKVRSKTFTLKCLHRPDDVRSFEELSSVGSADSESKMMGLAVVVDRLSALAQNLRHFLGGVIL